MNQEKCVICFEGCEEKTPGNHAGRMICIASIECLKRMGNVNCPKCRTPLKSREDSDDESNGSEWDEDDINIYDFLHDMLGDFDCPESFMIKVMTLYLNNHNFQVVPNGTVTLTSRFL